MVVLGGEGKGVVVVEREMAVMVGGVGRLRRAVVRAVPTVPRAWEGELTEEGMLGKRETNA